MKRMLVKDAFLLQEILLKTDFWGLEKIPTVEISH